jgi:hypothetical protein
MLGKNKEIPTEKVLDMQRQGLQNNEIISNLKDQGYKHEQIANAMDQARIKGEISNIDLPEKEPIKEASDIPIGLMNAPAPSTEKTTAEEISNPPEQKFTTPEQVTGFAPEPLERANYDAIEEIAESIIKEKWDELIKGIGDIKLWKERIDIDLEGVKQEIVRTQEKFENLQKALMGKVKEYSEGVTNISTEMRALERVLERILSPLTKSVKDLQEVSEKISKKTSAIKYSNKKTSKRKRK